MSTQSKYHEQIEAVIRKVRETGEPASVQAEDRAEIYAYPRSEGRVAWGINSPDAGFNVLRGIRKPDGTDEGVR
jgi:hypothetical protein